jgi:hypothetical protein
LLPVLDKNKEHINVFGVSPTKLVFPLSFAVFILAGVRKFF